MQESAMDDTSNVPADKLTKAYIKIRAERAALSADFKEKDGELVYRSSIPSTYWWRSYTKTE